MPGEAGSHEARRLGPTEQIRQPIEHGTQDGETRRQRSLVKSAICRATHELLGVLGDRRPGSVPLGRRHEIAHVRQSAPARDAGGYTASSGFEADDRHPPIAPQPVRRHRVVRVPELRLERLLHDGDAPIAGPDAGRRSHKRPLGQSVRGEQAIDHRPDSAFVFKMLTCRNRAAGQPWLTDALCIGWPFPQLNEPPSWYVDGPPTASIDPQKSVVRA